LPTTKGLEATVTVGPEGETVSGEEDESKEDFPDYTPELVKRQMRHSRCEHIER
jgi:hypothetical protein